MQDSNRRVVLSWGVSNNNSDVDDIPSLERLRAYSRDAYRNQPIIRNAIDTRADAVVGNGLKLQATPKADILGITPEEATEWATKIEFLFDWWAKSKYSDFTGLNNFYGLQKVAYKSTDLSGDVGFSIQMSPSLDTPFETTIRLYEADRICNPNEDEDTEKIAGGVELDNKGRAVAYHLTKKPLNGIEQTAPEWVRVKARDKNNSLNFGLLARRDRPDQRRGVPILAPVLEMLKILDEYINAELTSAEVSSLYAVFIKSESGDVGMPIKIDESDIQPLPEEENIKLRAGMVVSLREGESIETSNPLRPNPNFDPFVQAVIKLIAGAIQVPYEILIKHFQASYSASRGALLWFQKFFKIEREWFTIDFINPIYEAFVSECVAKGYIEAKGFFEDPIMKKAWLGASWVGMSQGLLDPLKEVKASTAKIENGLSTYERESLELNGSSFDENIKRLNREFRLLAEAKQKATEIENRSNNDSN